MSASKRILILTADAGFGHRSAAAAVEAALRDRFGAACTVETVNVLSSAHTPGWLRDSQSDYDRLARDLPDLYRTGYDLSDGTLLARMVENALRTLLYRALRETLERSRPDVIISTYPLYQAALGAVFALTGSYVPLICVVTDLVTVHRLWFSEDADLTVVPTPQVHALAVEAGLPPEQLEIIGIPVHPRLVQEQRSKAEIRAELGWDPTLITLLAVGSKRVTGLDGVLNVLNHAGWPLQLALVAGGDDARFEAWSRTEWHRPTHRYNFVDNMPVLLRAADCILCKAGGLIVTESLAAGLPMLLTDVIPGQETGNAAYVIEGGAGDMADDPIGALETLGHWLMDEARLLKIRSANAARLGRPRAAYDIAERAWQLAQRGPQRREPNQIVGLPRLIELFRRFNVPWKEE